MATDYTGLITGQHRDKPKFAAWVAVLTGALVQVQQATQALTADFDVETAVGVQLDAVGLWVGLSRRQTVPITGAFFAWNTDGVGWNEANWRGPYEPDQGVVNLDDETYRAVLQARIGANYWLGSNEDLLAISLSATTTALGIQTFVIDNMDMSTTVYILGAPTNVLIELIKRGLTPPKAAGVRVAGYILASRTGAPFFALDSTTTLATAGLDFGAFGAPA